MKRKMYILLIMGLLVFSGCNLFKGLDKETLDGNSFDFKVEESMASGDYSVVVNLVTDKINNTPELKAIDNAILALAKPSTSTTAIETYYTALTDNIVGYSTTPAVKQFVDLKLTQAEAEAGLAGLKMTDIVANLKKVTTSSNTISKSIVAEINIADLIPKGLNTTNLSNAVNSYMSGLPRGTVVDELRLKYLNGVLTLSISALHRFLVIFDDPATEAIDFLLYTADRQSSWNTYKAQAKLEVIAAQKYLNQYGTASGLISSDDLTKINTNLTAVLADIDFSDAAGYDRLKAAVK